jgi:hypothetical protein
MGCVVGGSQSNPNTCPTPQTPQEPADAAVSEIRGLLDDGGWAQDNITYDELVDIKSSLEGLSPPDANDAISQLTDEELSTIAGEIDSTGLSNSNGLSYSEKDALIGNLAGKLNATQFGRLAAAFDDPQPIAESVAAHGTTDAKIGFIDAHNENTTNPDTALAIGTVLSSMGGDQDGLSRALSVDADNRSTGVLSRAELSNVLARSLETTTFGSGSPMGGAPSQSISATRVNNILDAIATSDNVAIKANAFDAASDTLRELQDIDANVIQRGFTGLHDAGNAATTIAEHMNSLLQTDVRGIVSSLESTEITGKGMTTWSRQMLDDGKARQLNSVLHELRGDPANVYLSDPEAAQDLGYMLGSIKAGLTSLQTSNKESADQVRDILGLGTGYIPNRIGGVVNMVIHPLVDQNLGEQELDALGSSIRTEDIPAELLNLMTHGLPAEIEQFVTGSAGAVIDW